MINCYVLKVNFRINFVKMSKNFVNLMDMNSQ